MSIADFALKRLKDLGKGTRKGIEVAGDVSTVASKPIDWVAKGAVEGTTFVAKHSVKKDTPRFWNGYTGYKQSKTGTGLAIGAAGLWAAGSITVNKEFQPKLGEVSYGQTAPIHNADGVSSTTNAPTLGASGDMLFGMHKGRKG